MNAVRPAYGFCSATFTPTWSEPVYHRDVSWGFTPW